MRSCGPEWRWIFIRIAAVGTLKSVAPMLTGSRAGLLEASAPQVGHKQIGDQRDRACGDRASRQERNQVAVRSCANACDVPGCRKQRHRSSIV